MDNHGVILGQRPEDYIAGGFTFISFEERNPSGDWRPYLPVGEKQYGKEDWLACVSFSATSAIEIQEKFLTGKESNYSDRFIAKMSGTTHEGNYLYKVGDAIRNLGLVAETSYPTSTTYTFDEYYADIPTDLLNQLLAEGKTWKQKWLVKTEFVPATKEFMMKHIKHAPLQIVIPGHAIVNFLCEDDIVNYFDSYSPFQKKINYSQVQAAYKYVLTFMEPIKRFIINDGGKLGVVIMQGFNITGFFAKDQEAFEALKKSLSFTGNEPTYNYPQ